VYHHEDGQIWLVSHKQNYLISMYA